jgi:glucose/arabinose dehydrogenase
MSAGFHMGDAMGNIGETMKNGSRKRAAKAAFARFATIAASALMGAMAVQAVEVGLHPGYALTTLRPAGFEPKVAGMEFLPNGDMLVLTWRGSTGPHTNQAGTGIDMTGTRTGTTKLYKVTNTQGNDAAAIQYTEIASGFKDAHGLCIVNGDIYVGDIDRIVKLVDKDGDGKFETLQEIGKIPSYDGWFEYAFGPVHKDGKLYMALAVGVQSSGWPTKQMGKDRGTILSFPIGGGTYTVVAEGLRAPNGIAIGPDGEIFVTDNQGGWRPASPFFHVKQDKFYGYRADPVGPIQKTFRTAERIAKGDTVTPPAIWSPYREANDSPTEPALMKSGPYAGQFIYGDISLGGIYRAFLEKVNGEYQGGMIQHSGGLECGVERMRTGPNGEIYMGGLGTGSQDNQGWKGKTFGLQKMVPNGTQTFEMISVRSRSTGMEIDFSMPVGASAEATANYAVQQWYYLPDSAYGGAKKGVTNRTVKSVKVSTDRKKVFLEITGLAKGQVVYIAANNIKSQTGDKSLWYSKTWYTLNAISPSLAFEPPVGVKTSAFASPLAPLRFEMRAHGLKVILPDAGAYKVELLDFMGRVVSSAVSAGGSAEIRIPAGRSGLHLIRAEGVGKALSRPIVL